MSDFPTMLTGSPGETFRTAQMPDEDIDEVVNLGDFSGTASSWSSGTLDLSPYKKVEITVEAGANAGTAPYVRFNGDTGNNYWSSAKYVQGGNGVNWFGAAGYQGPTNGNRALISIGTAGTADLASMITIIPASTPGGNRRRFFFRGQAEIPVPTVNSFTQSDGGGFWLSAAPITSISITFSTAVAYTVSVRGYR